ncbi:MAG: ABC transporter permease [Oscillospiraceae bacterium]|nr:ABC transporter permease [Oscillospiraceae bacterium]
MQSKRSFFNRTLFLKNLSRFWPLWGGVSIAGALFPLYLILNLLVDPSMRPDGAELAEMLYELATHFAPIFVFLYAILCAMLVWGYLYSPRAVGLMHTLPVDRTCLFVTSTLSGLAMTVIPFVAVGGMIVLISLLWGFISPVAILYTVFAVLCLISLFFGIATFCAMITGHTAALPVLYLLVNFLAFILEALTGLLTQFFMLGVSRIETHTLQFLSPLVQIMDKFRTVSVYDDSYPFTQLSGSARLTAVTDTYGDGSLRYIGLEGLGTVALYGLAGLVLLALAWLLYQKRRSESAGDVAAFAPLRPVLRFGIAALSAMSLGLLLYYLFWETLVESKLNILASFIPLVFFMAVGGLIGYYVSSMLLEKSLRVFRGSLKGAAIVCAGVLVLCTVLKLDPFRMVDRIPSLEEIESVNLYAAGTDLYYTTGTADGQLVVGQILDLHRTILDHKDEISALTWEDYNRIWDEVYDGPDSESNVATTNCHIDYRLKNGGSISRSYTFISVRPNPDGPDSVNGKLDTLLTSEPVRLDQVRVPEDGTLLRIEVYGSFNNYSDDGSAREDSDTKRIYDALLLDAKNGSIPGDYYWHIGGTMPVYHDIRIEVDYTVRDPERNNSEYVRAKGVYLSDSMTNTIQALIDTGVFTEEEFTALRQELLEEKG